MVPTWDYVTVHVYGDLVAHDDLDWTSQVVRRLTEKHEGRTPVGSGPASAESAQPVGWTVDDAAPGYVEAMLRAIVGLELRITRIVAKAKMSQNKTPASAGSARPTVCANRPPLDMPHATTGSVSLLFALNDHASAELQGSATALVNETDVRYPTQSLALRLGYRF